MPINLIYTCQIKRNMVDVLTDKRGWKESPAEAVILGAFEPNPDGILTELNKLLDKAVEPLIRKKEFTGELGQMKLINTLKKLPCENILLVGLGKRDEFDLERLRRVSGSAARALRDNGIKTIATTLHNTPTRKATLREQAQATAEGTILGLYQFTKYKTLNKEKIKETKSLTLLDADKAAEEGAQTGKAIADAQNHVRDLVNEPAMTLTPEKLAEAALELKKLGVKVTVYDKKGIEKLGLNAVLAVNRGSAQEPRFVILEYRKGTGAPVAIVGKGITFDSGGLDLKPANYMLDMKSDMAGAAAVIGTIKAVAELGLNVNVVGIFASTENMPGCNAYKPGDVVIGYNGRTMEIGNTDAEGRIILSDTLAYTEKNFKPRCIIDLATLTGACIIALGYAAAGVMSKDPALVNKLKLAGEASGERLWELPMWDDYKENVKSDVADVLNIPGGKGYEAGAIAGAWFLQHFVEKTPWAHIDIAGPAWSIDRRHYWDKGGTGFGVRLLVEFLKAVR
jgi:leucyl aminopeptidase